MMAIDNNISLTVMLTETEHCQNVYEEIQTNDDDDPGKQGEIYWKPPTNAVRRKAWNFLTRYTTAGGQFSNTIWVWAIR